MGNLVPLAACLDSRYNSGPDLEKPGNLKREDAAYKGQSMK